MTEYSLPVLFQRWRQRLAPPLAPAPSVLAPPERKVEPEAILFRIISGDRPPLRPAGTTREQLRFLLEQEPDHPGLAKRWVLNRLPDPGERQALVELLEEHHQCWSELPFEAAAYAQCWTDIGALPDHLHPWSQDFPHRSAAEQAAVLDYVARSKNLYLLNRNGARNWALETGLKESPWVLPWDGACFLTSEAWQVIRPLLQVPRLAYLAVPMAALTHQDALSGGPDHPPHARLAPQLGFSRRAREHYPPQQRDGLWDDAPLFRRLCLVGPWLDPEAWAGVGPWDTVDATPVPDCAQLVQAGWTYRLPGTLAPEATLPIEGQVRLQSLDSIRVLTRRTDMAILDAALRAGTLRCWTALAGLSSTVPEVAAIAANARAIPPPSVTDKAEPLPGIAHRSYINAVPHWQSLAGSEHSLDRSALLDATGPACGDVAQTYDRARLQWMVDCVCSLALDTHLNANQASQEHAQRMLRTWFLDPKTAMIPDGAHARVSSSDRQRNPLDAAIDFRDFYPLLDAITLLREAGALSLVDEQQLNEWLDAFLGWLTRDSAAFLRDHCAQTSCTWYHLVVLAIAAHRRKRNVAAQVFDNLPGLLAKQFRPDGTPRDRGPDDQLSHAHLFNLQAWTNLVVISSALGRDLWGITTSSGLSLPGVMAHAKRAVTGARPLATATKAMGARQWLGAMEGFLPTGTPPGEDLRLPPLPEVSTGLPPFWRLCRPLSPPTPPESAPSPPPHWPGC